MSSLEKESIKIMARNREAYHEYFVEEEFEAGIELCGTEVKSIRAGNLNLKDAWCGIKNGEMILNQMHISPYDHGNIFNRDEKRPRRLLMHKREIMRLFGKVKQDGYSLIPLSVYFKGSRVKVKVGLCKGKKLYDKRASAAERDAKRQIERGAGITEAAFGAGFSSIRTFNHRFAKESGMTPREFRQHIVEENVAPDGPKPA